MEISERHSIGNKIVSQGSFGHTLCEILLFVDGDFTLNFLRREGELLYLSLSLSLYIERIHAFLAVWVYSTDTLQSTKRQHRDFKETLTIRNRYETRKVTWTSDQSDLESNKTSMFF